MKMAVLILAGLCSLPQLARAQSESDQLNMRLAQTMAQALRDAGADVGESENGSLEAAALRAIQIQDRSNQFASAEDDASKMTTHQLLLCAKVKIAFMLRGEMGICTDTQGRISELTGGGVGLAAGAAGSLIALIYTGSPLKSYRGAYSGGGIASAKAYLGDLAAMVSKLPKLVGPDLAYFGREDGASIIMVGVQAGPMADFSIMTLNLK